MTSYRAASGHDVALGSLNVLSPQPDEEHGGGIQYTRATRAADGSLILEGPYFPFVWEAVTASQFSTLLTNFGLSASTHSANVTIYVRDINLSTWVRKNGVAQVPLPGENVRWNNRPVDLTILVTITGDAA